MKKLENKRDITHLFIICWIAYFSLYLGRLNFSATLSHITLTEGYTRTQMGLVVSGFYIGYGIGQFINGILGDYLKPRIFIFCGLICSSTMNFFMGIIGSWEWMVALWIVNGFVQSMIWSPMIRMVADWTFQSDCRKICINLSTSNVCGTICAYVICSTYIRFFAWRGIFVCSSILLAVVAMVWIIETKRLEMERTEYKESVNTDDSNSAMKCISRYLLISLPLIGGITILQGFIRDSVTTWLPSLLSENFAVTTSSSMLLTAILPILNLFGVYISSFVFRRKKNEVATIRLFFALATLASGFLYLFKCDSISLTLIGFALLSASMTAIDTMTITMIPLRFSACHRVSTVTGILNSTTYLGSSLSVYIMAKVVESTGSWQKALLPWMFVAIAGILFSIITNVFWKRMKEEGKE